jgi:hypothetical protein
MLRLSAFVSVIGLLCVGIGGCSETTKAKTQADAPEQSATSESRPADEKPAEAADEAVEADESTPSSIIGRWIVVISQRGRNTPLMMIEVSQDEQGEHVAKLLENGPNLRGDAPIKSFDTDGKNVHIVFAMEGGDLDFEGSLWGDVVPGNLMLGEERCMPARLSRATVATLEGTLPAEDDALKALSETFRANEAVAGLRKFCDDNPKSPLAIDAFEAIFSFAKHENVPEEALEEHAQQYMKTAAFWGPRMVPAAQIGLAFNLARSGYLPEMALRHLREVQSSLSDPISDGWQFRINLAKGRVLVSLDNEEQRKQGGALLRLLHDEEEFDKGLTSELAKYVRAHGSKDEAIELYAELATLPPTIDELRARQMAARNGPGADTEPTPSEVIAELWEEKYGDTEKLEAHLNEVYRSAIYRFAANRVAPREEGEENQVVLCELFTGAACPPCVAADVASGGLATTFDHSQVIVLRYHQHIPQPDPLTSEDSESRFHYYAGYYDELRGTPAILLNGQLVQGVGGYLGEARDVYRRLQGQTKGLLGEHSDVRVLLSAEAANGVVEVTASVEGLEEASENLRLRLALAEAEIVFPAANGIRIHHMVVRAMPGGVEGIEPGDDGFKFSGSIEIAALEEELANYLAAYEQGQRMEFPHKPIQIQKLYLVGFLQNDSTKNVLQSVAIPVSGSLKAAADQAATDEPSTDEPSGNDDS